MTPRCREEFLLREASLPTAPGAFQVAELRGAGGDMGQASPLNGQSRPFLQAPQGLPPGVVKVI